MHLYSVFLYRDYILNLLHHINFFIIYYSKIKLHYEINNYLEQFFFKRIIIIKVII